MAEDSGRLHRRGARWEDHQSGGLRVREPGAPDSGQAGDDLFTAALTLLLARDGKLSIDDPIRKHLPEAAEAWSAITIRHLLTHTSGLSDPYSKLDLRKDYTDAELLKIEGELPLLFPPGEKWSYSNMGYHVLGFLCNRVGGKFYIDQLKERIFAPAKMTTARGISEAEIIPNRAAGYELEKGRPQNQAWVAPVLNTTADGSLYLTVLDLARWDAALYTEIPLSAALKESSWTQATLTSGKKTEYGFGWQLDEVNGHRRVHHGGAWQGFTTQISRYVDDRLTVIVLTNLAGANPPRIADKIAGIYLPAVAAKPPALLPDTEPKTTALLKETLLKAAEGTLGPDPFDRVMQTALFPDRIKALGASLKEKGKLQSLGVLSRKEKDGLRSHEYLVTYEWDAFRMTMTLNAENRIVGLGIRPE
jgi:hypothetical protein